MFMILWSVLSPNGRVFFCWNKSVIVWLCHHFSHMFVFIIFGHPQSHTWDAPSMSYSLPRYSSLFVFIAAPSGPTIMHVELSRVCFDWRLTHSPEPSQAAHQSTQFLHKHVPHFLSIPSFQTTPRYLALYASSLVNSISTLNRTPYERASSHSYLSFWIDDKLSFKVILLNWLKTKE